MFDSIKLSPLGKTWILDLDGTIVRHNGYKLDGADTFLPGAQEFLKSMSTEDMVIFITSRTQEQAGITENFLREHEVRYNAILYGAPYGERVLINDRKPSGLPTAIAVNTERDVFCGVKFEIDSHL